MHGNPVKILIDKRETVSLTAMPFFCSILIGIPLEFFLLPTVCSTSFFRMKAAAEFLSEFCRGSRTSNRRMEEHSGL